MKVGVVILALVTGTSAFSAAPMLSRTAMHQHHSLTVRMANDEPAAVERVAAAAAYLFPITDGFGFGGYIYQNVPPLGALAYQVAPAINAFNSVPFLGLIFFIAFSSFSRNTGLSRFVRFNLQQALLLDIALIIPGFVGSASQMFPVDLQVLGSNTVFEAMLLVVGYAWFSIAQGKVPDQVPVLSNAAFQSIGPM
eukprot:CAMPEP_0174696288 /NCGR_PEP_ID=MMETSP1094-20130205/2468_1 /TAXON_ID=156173 /ORGANISM="Chrysochromulina brevifilum, Strain UTEX LB 985" /LENGTH=194 /DNA_ID=CAMNT_0015893017 /DNA_START=18 /DNA_END=602 /DNA_ORIENTATION=-